MGENDPLTHEGRIKHKGPPWWRSARYLLAFLASWGYGNHFFQRINLSMAIVCMVNHTAVDLSNTQNTGQLIGHSATNYTDALMTHYTDVFGGIQKNSTLEESCSAIKQDKEDGELVWSKSTQGLVLGGLYGGYTFLHMPAQRIIQTVGAKRLSMLSVLGMSILTMTLPEVARLTPWLMLAIRIVQGALSAMGVAAIYAMWGAWAPPQERTTLLSISFSGSMISSAIVLPTSGLLCRYGFLDGWPSVFYVFGLVGFLWCLLWQLFVFETPESHPRIDPQESSYITTSIGPKTHENKGAIPWLKIFASMPAWAVVIGNVGYNWPFFMLLAVLPQYMREVLSFDIESNGFYSTLPYLTLFLCTNIWGSVCQRLQGKELVSVTTIRKLSTAVGTVIPAALYFGLSYFDCTQAVTVVVLMSLAIGISGANYQGYLINPYDIAPKYATAILCLSNTVAVALGLVSPYIVAAITIDKTRDQWQTVFFLTSGIIIACCIFYLIFGSGTQMDWTKTCDENGQADVNPQEITITVKSPHSNGELSPDIDQSQINNHNIIATKSHFNGTITLNTDNKDEVEKVLFTIAQPANQTFNQSEGQTVAIGYSTRL